jgi:hypothetical protein
MITNRARAYAARAAMADAAAIEEKSPFTAPPSRCGRIDEDPRQETGFLRLFHEMAPAAARLPAGRPATGPAQ